MAFLEFGGNRTPVPAGEMLIGSGTECHLRLGAPGISLRAAVLTTAADLSVSVRKLDAVGAIEVNGVAIGPLPQPLLHGDKLTIGGLEVMFVDERKSGSTQYVSAVNLQNLPLAKPAQPGKATAATGGRLVSLVDGREYTIAQSLKFGRDASADVVVANSQVSRRHAEIMVSPRGYILVDSSTNGTFVNGERVQNQRLLSRADIIKIGEEEFRFYADVLPAALPPPPAPAPQPAAAAPQPAAAAAAVAPPGEPASPAHLISTGYFPSPGKPGAAPIAEAPRASQTGPLAKFLVRSGTLKGQRLFVKVPIVNIGRADYNDLVVPDDSVSSQHAKLTRREGVWILSDLGSTNGTMVDGEKVDGDVPIAPGAFIRFGDVQLVFEPTDDAAGMQKGGSTRMISAAELKNFKPGR